MLTELEQYTDVGCHYSMGNTIEYVQNSLLSFYGIDKAVEGVEHVGICLPGVLNVAH